MREEDAMYWVKDGLKYCKVCGEPKPILHGMMQQILKQINITIIQMASFIRLIQLWDRVEMTATNMFVTKQAERLIQ